jgi:hypothetical protein
MTGIPPAIASSTAMHSSSAVDAVQNESARRSAARFSSSETGPRTFRL